MPGHSSNPSVASANVCPVDNASESFVADVIGAPDNIPADHAGLVLVAGVVGAVKGEVPDRTTHQPSLPGHLLRRWRTPRRL